MSSISYLATKYVANLDLASRLQRCYEGTLKKNLRFNCLVEQESIPVGCVPSVAVAVCCGGGGGRGEVLPRSGRVSAQEGEGVSPDPSVN